MAQTKAKTSKKPAAATPVKTPMRREIGAAVCLLLSVYLFACFFNGGPWLTQPRAALRWLIGAGFYVLPFALFADAAILCFHRGKPVRLRVICSLCFPVAVGFLWTDLGLTGKAAAWLSERLLPWFVKLIFALVGILLLVFVFGKTVARLVSSYRARERAQYTPAPEPAFEPRIPRRRPKKSEIDIPIDDAPPVRRRVEPYAASPPEEEPPRRPRRDNDIPLDIPFMEDNGTPKRAPRRKPAAPATFADEEPYNKADDGYSFPPAELLASGGGVAADGTEEVRVNTERLEATFRSFGVNVGISNATRGPSVTRYEAELEAGVKLSRLTNLADDIALSLGASGVRIGPMPDRISTVGIEVPNKIVSTVFLRELIESPEFRTAPGKLSFAIGKNISGDCIVGNIAKLPHLLVAGTTGSGKSVCLNSLILSILYKATPDEVRFIMIDPKMVEFRIFNGIPHLLVPVVTDVKKASGALQWAVIEMEKRYRMLSEQNVRDLEGYNKAMVKKGEVTLPQIVVVIDELADLMMTCGKEVEESIVRVAQKGRAAGVHLVIATQSPRADVITGLMKANIPSRIALKVSSALESRIILDAGGGADKLVGNGDMLFAPMGTTKPVRIQGTWVTDAEREAVVAYIKTRGETSYSDDVMLEIERAAAAEKSSAKPEPDPGASDFDELLPAAADVIFDVQQASTSMLQRRLKLGYARAARIVDQLEQIGLLGPFEGSKPRQILLTREQWREMQLIQGTAPVERYADSDDDAPF